MKKPIALLLLACMMLCVVSALAEPTVGTHPQQGDQGGARAAILEKLLGPGGVVTNRAILDALNMGFGVVGGNGNSNAIRQKVDAVSNGAETGGEEEVPEAGCGGEFGACEDCTCPAGCQCGSIPADD